jgi:hypothetical protein
MVWTCTRGEACGKKQLPSEAAENHLKGAACLSLLQYKLLQVAFLLLFTTYTFQVVRDRGGAQEAAAGHMHG